MASSHRATLSGNIPASFETDAADAGETHFEWLVRVVLEQDRRQTPFAYGGKAGLHDRRHWDLRASLFAPRALLQGG